jgi:hypothetical protein
MTSWSNHGQELESCIGRKKEKAFATNKYHYHQIRSSKDSVIPVEFLPSPSIIAVPQFLINEELFQNT